MRKPMIDEVRSLTYLWDTEQPEPRVAYECLLAHVVGINGYVYHYLTSNLTETEQADLRLPSMREALRVIIVTCARFHALHESFASLGPISKVACLAACSHWARARCSPAIALTDVEELVDEVYAHERANEEKRGGKWWLAELRARPTLRIVEG